jgi:hypothetical protein
VTLSEGHCSQELVVHPLATFLQQIMSAQHRQGRQNPPRLLPVLILFPLKKESTEKMSSLNNLNVLLYFKVPPPLGKAEDLKLNTHTHTHHSTIALHLSRDVN